MNRITIRVDDIQRLRRAMPGFGGSFRSVAELREIAWHLSDAQDGELAAGVRALVDTVPEARDLLRRLQPLRPGTTAYLALATAICHVPDDALRRSLKDALCACVEAAAGRPLHVERRRQARYA